MRFSNTAALMLVAATVAAADADGWTTILDATSFAQWKVAPEKADQVVVEREGVKEIRAADGTVLGAWRFADGVLSGEGAVSHIFSPRADYADLRFSAELNIGDDSNSGMYFRTKFGNGWPDGYEAQINANFGDPQKSGSLYGVVRVETSPVPANTWYTQEIVADGDHLTISINGVVTADARDGKRSVGHVVFQQHHPGSRVMIRNVRVLELTKAAK